MQACIDLHAPLYLGLYSLGSGSAWLYIAAITFASFAVGAVAVAILWLVARSKDMTDSRQTFSSVDDAAAFADSQDAAGFDCFMSRRGNNWEVRCYRRQEQRK
ncbi:hypothetical protein [Xanthomonas sp. A1809]|uniref:hypothetical protein n=1 Tax=Xanthomonas sp. A1809 TaxID=2821275 RepID=UPI001ADCF40C|nr:hypothetical protein [Xanthomonas sp. A1809]MBO9858318.1 hypothetical protein [Xanthomonas sp. A1809]